MFFFFFFSRTPLLQIDSAVRVFDAVSQMPTVIGANGFFQAFSGALDTVDAIRGVEVGENVFVCCNNSSILTHTHSLGSSSTNNCFACCSSNSIGRLSFDVVA
jgi:hypothetical protein